MTRPKRASGRVRHAVRVELLLAVVERGERCYASQRAAARELANVLGVSAETVRLALRDWTLEAERALAISLREPFGATAAGPGYPDEFPQVPSASYPEDPAATPKPPEPSNPQVTAASPVTPAEPPYTSLLTTNSNDTASAAAAAAPFRPTKNRPDKLTRNKLAGLCHADGCELSLPIGAGLVPNGFEPNCSRLYCHAHAAAGLVEAQTEWDERTAFADLVAMYGMPAPQSISEDNP